MSGGFVAEEEIEPLQLQIPVSSHETRFQECVTGQDFSFAQNLLNGPRSFKVLVLGILLAILFKLFDWRMYMDGALNKFFPAIQAFNLYAYTRNSVDHAIAIALILMPLTYFMSKDKNLVKDTEKSRWIEEFTAGLDIIAGTSKKAYKHHLDDSWRRLKRQINQLLFKGLREIRSRNKKEATYVDAKWINAVGDEIKKIKELNVPNPNELDASLRKECLEVLIYNLIAFHILPTISAINLEKVDEKLMEKIAKHLSSHVISILVYKNKLPVFLRFAEANKPRIPANPQFQQLNSIFKQVQRREDSMPEEISGVEKDEIELQEPPLRQPPRKRRYSPSASPEM